MARIAVVVVTTAAQISFQNAVQSGDQYANDGETELYVMNSSASPIIVTRLVQTQPEPPDTCADNTVSCAAESLSILGALSPRRYSTPSGDVQVRYPTAQAVNLTVVAVRTVRSR